MGVMWVCEGRWREFVFNSPMAYGKKPLWNLAVLLWRLQFSCINSPRWGWEVSLLMLRVLVRQCFCACPGWEEVSSRLIFSAVLTILCKPVELNRPWEERDSGWELFWSTPCVPGVLLSVGSERCGHCSLWFPFLRPDISREQP